MPENSENARASKFKLRKKLLCMNLIKTSLSAVLHCAAELHQVLPQLPPAGQKQIFLMQSCQLSGTTVFDDLYEKKKCGQLRVIPGVIQHHVSEKFSVGSLEAKPLLLPAVLKYHKSSRKICMTKYISKNFNTCMVKKNESNKVAPCGDLWPQATTACPQDQNKIHGRSGENIFLHSAGAEPPNVRTKNGKNHA